MCASACGGEVVCMSGRTVMVEVEVSLLEACLPEGRCQWCRTLTDRYVSSQGGSNYFCVLCRGPEGGDVTHLRANQAKVIALGEAVLASAGYGERARGGR